MAANGIWNKIGVLFTGAALMLALITSSPSVEQKAILIIFVLLAVITLYFDNRIRKLEAPRAANMEEKIFEKLLNLENLIKGKKAKVEFDPVVIGLLLMALLALLYLFFIAPK